MRWSSGAFIVLLCITLGLLVWTRLEVAEALRESASTRSQLADARSEAAALRSQIAALATTRAAADVADAEKHAAEASLERSLSVELKQVRESARMARSELLIVKNISDKAIRIDRVGGEGAVLFRVKPSINGLTEIEDGGFVALLPGESARYAVQNPSDPAFGIARDLHEAIVDSEHVRATFHPQPSTKPATEP